MRIGTGIAENMSLPFALSRAPTSLAVPVSSTHPRSMKTTFVDKASASSSRCSERMIVVPSSRLILPSVERKSVAAIGSSWLVGSSRRSTDGSSAITDAKFTSCFLPARELGHGLIEPVLDAEIRCNFRHAAADRRRVQPQRLQAERQLVPDLVGHQLRVQVLQHKADAGALLALGKGL